MVVRVVGGEGGVWVGRSAGTAVVVRVVGGGLWVMRVGWWVVAVVGSWAVGGGGGTVGVAGVAAAVGSGDGGWVGGWRWLAGGHRPNPLRRYIGLSHRAPQPLPSVAGLAWRHHGTKPLPPSRYPFASLL